MIKQCSDTLGNTCFPCDSMEWTQWRIQVNGRTSNLMDVKCRSKIRGNKNCMKQFGIFQQWAPHSTNNLREQNKERTNTTTTIWFDLWGI